MAFLCGYGVYVVLALSLLLHPASDSDAVDPGTQIALEFWQLVLAFAVGLAVASRLGPSGVKDWLIGAREARAGRAALGAAWLLVALGCGWVIVAVFGLTTSNAGLRDGWPRYDLLAAAVMAGIGEELLVLALPYLVLSRIRMRDGRPIPSLAATSVLIALRMSYHLYYGWAALSLLPWAITSVVVYAGLQRVWPLIVTHAAYDAVLVLGVGGGATLAVALLATIFLLFRLGRARGTNDLIRRGSAGRPEPGPRPSSP